MGEELHQLISVSSDFEQFESLNSLFDKTVVEAGSWLAFQVAVDTGGNSSET